ncbi:MAG: hypothetical protein QM727_08805 [Niabella sp.]
MSCTSIGITNPFICFIRTLCPNNIPVVYAKDYREVSNSFPEYFSYLSKELDSLKTYKRIWLVVNDYYQSDIGEKIDAPDWYFANGIKPTDRIISEFLKRGKQVYSFDSFDAKLYCIEQGKEKE